MAIYDLTKEIPANINVGDVLNCPYSGKAIELTLEFGKYLLECWGAQGGSFYYASGGAGGYCSGELSLAEPTKLFLYTGGQPARVSDIAAKGSGGFNGGGSAMPRQYSGTETMSQPGGGASDIRINEDSLYARVIVAGGGGGSASTVSLDTKFGGGETGGCTYSEYKATQTSPGIGASFGVGGDASLLGPNYKYGAGGGGGGWYGGGAIAEHTDQDETYREKNGGGSGYVYSYETESNYPSGCLLNSDYFLSNCNNIAGDKNIVLPSGDSSVGNIGNGYIRITMLEKKILPRRGLYIKINGSWIKAI